MIMKVTAALCGLLLATPSQAADIIVVSQQDPAIVVIKGQLNQGDQNTFRQTADRFTGVIVFLESPVAM